MSEDQVQVREIAEKAFYLRTLITVMLRDLVEFETLIEKHSDKLGEVQMEWLHRTADNLRSRIRPSIDNFDQVRAVLDKEKMGRPE